MYVYCIIIRFVSIIKYNFITIYITNIHNVNYTRIYIIYLPRHHFLIQNVNIYIFLINLNVLTFYKILYYYYSLKK